MLEHYEELFSVFFLSLLVFVFFMLLFNRLDFYSRISFFLESSHSNLTGGLLEHL